MRHPRPARHGCPLVAAALLLSATVQSLAAQAPAWFLPSRDHFPVFLAGARDPATTARLLVATEPVDRFGQGLTGDVSLGTLIPLVRLAGTTPRDALVLGGEAAVFGRFSLQVNSRDIISSDWLFTLPLVWHQGDHWLRWRYYHMSCHLGDEYRSRFEETAINFGRDAFDLTAYRRLLPWLGGYALVNWAYIVHPNDAERWTLRGGFQTELTPGDGRFVVPYAAVDVELPQYTGWKPRIDVQGGVWLPARDGRRWVRVAAQFYTGPSPRGQFYDVHARFVSVGVVINP